MRECFDATYYGVIGKRWMQHQFTAGFRDQTRLAWNGKFLFIRRLDKSERREAKRLVHGQNNNLWLVSSRHYPVPMGKQQGSAVADAEVLALGCLGV